MAPKQTLGRDVRSTLRLTEQDAELLAATADERRMSQTATIESLIRANCGRTTLRNLHQPRYDNYRRSLDEFLTAHDPPEQPKALRSIHLTAELIDYMRTNPVAPGRYFKVQVELTNEHMTAELVPHKQGELRPGIQLSFPHLEDPILPKVRAYRAQFTWIDMDRTGEEQLDAVKERLIDHFEAGLYHPFSHLYYKRRPSLFLMQLFGEPWRTWRSVTFKEVLSQAPHVIVSDHQFIVATEEVRDSLYHYRNPLEDIYVTARRIDEGDIPLLLGLVTERTEEMARFVEQIRPSFDPQKQYDKGNPRDTLLALLSPQIPYGVGHVF